MTAQEPEVPEGPPAPTSRALTLRTVVALLLVAAWFVWPVVGYAALVTVTPIMAELPTAEEQAQATRLALVGGCAGLLGPVLAYVLARGRTAIRGVAAVQLAITLLAALAFLVRSSS